MSSFNVVDLAKDFLEEKTGFYNGFEMSPASLQLKVNQSTYKGEWIYVMQLLRLYSVTFLFIDMKDEAMNIFDWRTNSIGTFFVKNMIAFENLHKSCDKHYGYGVRPCCGTLNEDVIDQVQELFTMPGDNVSLPEITYLFSVMDFRVLSDKSSRLENISPSKNVPILPLQGNLNPSFVTCFATIANNRPKIKEQEYYDQELLDSHDRKTSPCKELDIYPLCIDYCNWHKNLFKKWNYEDFLNIMRYSLPQRKSILNPIMPKEKQIAENLFGTDKIKDLNQVVAPMSMVVFCYEKNKGYVGDDIGMTAKLCNDFFPNPTDIGIGLSRNLNLEEIMHINSQYYPLFEPNLLTNTGKKIHGSLWSETTLVILTGGSSKQKSSLSQTYATQQNFEDGTIKFQIHQNKELSRMNLGSNYNKYTTAFELTANNEYFIDITPTGRVSTNEFKALNFKQRQCHLKNEGLKSSIFKIYTENNCKYECHVSLAQNLCKCIPWDYMLVERMEECDVFGRTCFVNAMKNLNRHPINQCKHCMKECDFIHYNKVITDKKSLTSGPYGGKYFNKESHWNNADQTIENVVTGNTAFKDFLLDINGTFMDQAMRNAYDSLYPRSANKIDDEQEIIYKSLIIVHLRFMEPDIEEINTKYTISDLIANFGGKFGIFAQVTGSSLLCLLNICILLFKVIFSYHTLKQIKKLVENFLSYCTSPSLNQQ